MLSNKIYLTRPNKDIEANEDDVKRFEKFALADFKMGKDVYIIEKFPKKFYYFATKIRIEKVVEPISSLSAVSNSRLFKVISTSSIYEWRIALANVWQQVELIKHKPLFFIAQLVVEFRQHYAILNQICAGTAKYGLAENNLENSYTSVNRI